MSFPERELERLLDAERATEARAPAQLMERMLADIQASVAATPAMDPSSRAVASKLGVTGGGAVKAFLVAGAVALGGMAAFQQLRPVFLSRTPAPVPAHPSNQEEVGRSAAALKAESVESPGQSHSVLASSNAALSASPASGAEPSTVNFPSPRPARRVSRTPAFVPLPAGPQEPQSAAEDTIQAELSLLDAARSSLLEGQPGSALERLAEHRAQFKQATFAEERDGLEVQALQASGRINEAIRAAKRFLAEHPRSLHRPSVERVLEGLAVTRQ